MFNSFYIYFDYIQIIVYSKILQIRKILKYFLFMHNRYKKF